MDGLGWEGKRERERDRLIRRSRYLQGEKEGRGKKDFEEDFGEGEVGIGRSKDRRRTGEETRELIIFRESD